MYLNELIRFASVALALVVSFGVIAATETDPSVLLSFWYLTAVVVLCCSKRFVSRNPLLLFLALYLAVYYQLRVADLLLFAEPLSFFPITLMASADMSAATSYVASCALALFLGISVLGRSRSAIKPLELASYPHPHSFYLPTPRSLFAIQLVIYATKYLQLVLLGGDEFVANAPLIVKIGALMLNPDVLLLLYFVSADIRGMLRGKLTIVVVVVYVVARAYLSYSRGGIIDAFVFFLAWKVVYDGNIRTVVSLKNLTRAVGGLAVSIYLFFLVAEIRASDYSFDGPSLTEVIEVGGAQYIAKTISYRLGSNMDASLYVFSKDYDRESARQVVNLRQTLQAVVRRVLHLRVFGEVVFSEHGLAQILGNEGYYAGDDRVNVAYLWGAPGLSYHLFGYTAGILANVLVGSILGGIFIQMRARSAQSFVHLILAVVVVLVFQSWVTTFGIDNIADRYARTLFMMGVSIGGYVFCKRSIRGAQGDVSVAVGEA
jgi:hypothetical protein